MKLAKWNDRGANVMRMNMQGLARRVKIPGFMTLCLTFSENELILGYNRLWCRYGKLLLRYLSCRGDHQRARARWRCRLIKRGVCIYWKKALFVISVTHMHNVPLSIVNGNLSLFSNITKFTSSTVKHRSLFLCAEWAYQWNGAQCLLQTNNHFSIHMN